jgi:NAD(P)-dependent dehydrogenase (short-subunit alcohol dehydrogenase family)
MDDRRHPPATADAAVMSEYFETMRQFLETQERVMAAFMGQAQAGNWRPALRPQRATPMPLPRAGTEMFAQAPAHKPLAATPAARVEPPVAAAEPATAKVAEATALAPAARGASHSVPAPGASVSREKMIEMILAIIEDKTGYPKDMVGLDQNLEADLGIDSIKRIEVVGAMLQALPEPYRVALNESRSKLNTQPTLNGMLELLTSVKIGGEATVPFDLAGTGAPVATGSHPSRHIIQAEAEPVADGTAATRLAQGEFVVAGEGGDIAQALASRLQQLGCSVQFVTPALLRDEPALLAWCRSQGNAPLAGVIHLGALDGAALDLDAGAANWRAELLACEKSGFLLLRELGARLGAGAHVLVATGLGGRFGRDGTHPALALQGGSVGLLKSVQEERPELRVKAVDVDPEQDADSIAATLLRELELVGGRIEVGYPGGVRTVFRTVPAQAQAADSASTLEGIVVLATGGARGITAETLRELARPGNTLVLTGRGELPAREPAELEPLAGADALRRHFIAQVRSGRIELTPAQIGRHVQQLLALREMRANIADFRASGAKVEYRAIDVTDEAAMASLLGDLYAHHGRIDGVVHGAGVIEDKLLAEKTSESWSRVVETKVFGLLLLARYLRPESLRFLTAFSSVAGRYGNSGQSDYAAANELMNRLCCQLSARWGGKVNVHALCWGPWGPTRHGAGMVTAETEAKFAAKGVTLVDARLGRELLAAELRRRPGGPVEIVCGQGPWERHEAEVGRIVPAPLHAEGPSRGALIGAARVTSRPTGQQLLELELDQRHLYLQEHAIDGMPVLPAAAALEIVAESAATLWPGWKVVEVRDFRLMKGVEFKTPRRALQVLVSPPPYGSSEGFEVNATLQSDLGNGRALAHYRGIVRLQQQLPRGERVRDGQHADRSLTARKAYGEWLFHGPRFQVIDEVRGISEVGASCRVHPTQPASWLQGSAARTQAWCFDPALLDGAAQMVWLWSRWRQDASALPSRFGRVVRYREKLPERLTMVYEALPSADAGLVRGTATFVDEAGDPVLLVEELESIASAALNRLGGTARTAIEA